MTLMRPALCIAVLVAAQAGCEGSSRPTLLTPHSFEIGAATTNLRVGEFLQVQAVMRSEGGTVLPDAKVTWSSTDETVMSVDTLGFVTAHWPGEAGVVGRAGELADTLFFQVHTPIGSVAIGPDSLRLILGDEHRLTVTAYDSSGAILPRLVKIRISSSNPEIVAIEEGSRLRAAGLGAAVVSVSAEGVEHAVRTQVLTVSFETISRGSGFACGLTADGEAVCWGGNRSSQLGVITPYQCIGSVNQYCGQASKNVPVYVDTPLRFELVDAGHLHACALTADHKAYCWGNDSFDQLGTTAETGFCSDLISGEGGRCTAKPLPVEGDHEFSSISAGWDHSCGVTTNNAAYCWGNGTYGALGNGSTESSVTPILVSGGHSFTQVSASSTHSCGLTLSGKAYCWGRNTLGELGIGTPDDIVHPEPVAVTGDLTFSQVSAGLSNTCGVTTDRSVYCWGYGAQLGSEPPETCPRTSNTTGDIPCAPYPVPINTEAVFVTVDSWTGMSCAVTPEGAAYCWSSHINLPIPVGGAPPFRSVSAGALAACGMGTDGVAYCWNSDLIAQKAPGQP